MEIVCVIKNGEYYVLPAFAPAISKITYILNNDLNISGADGYKYMSQITNFKMYSDEAVYEVSDIVHKSNSEATFKIKDSNGELINGRAWTPLRCYYHSNYGTSGHSMGNIFTGNSSLYNIVSANIPADKLGTDEAAIFIEFSKPISINRISFSDICQNNVTIKFDNKIVYNQPELKTGARDIVFFGKKSPGVL